MLFSFYETYPQVMELNIIPENQKTILKCLADFNLENVPTGNLGEYKT